MVFIVSQEFEEFPGRFTREVINFGVIDGFKIVYDVDNDTRRIYTTGGGIEKFVCKLADDEKSAKSKEVIQDIMKAHVTNEAHTIFDVDDFFTSVLDEVIDKDTLIEVMLGLLQRHGYEGIVDKFIELGESESEEEEVVKTGDLPKFQGLMN